MRWRGRDRRRKKKTWKNDSSVFISPVLNLEKILRSHGFYLSHFCNFSGKKKLRWFRFIYQNEWSLIKTIFLPAILTTSSPMITKANSKLWIVMITLKSAAVVYSNFQRQKKNHFFSLSTTVFFSMGRLGITMENYWRDFQFRCSTAFWTKRVGRLSTPLMTVLRSPASVERLWWYSCASTASLLGAVLAVGGPLKLRIVDGLCIIIKLQNKTVLKSAIWGQIFQRLARPSKSAKLVLLPFFSRPLNQRRLRELSLTEASAASRGWTCLRQVFLPRCNNFCCRIGFGKQYFIVSIPPILLYIRGNQSTCILSETFSSPFFQWDVSIRFFTAKKKALNSTVTSH